jgi:hypothetical protein
MKAKLEGIKDCTAMKNYFDVIMLIKAIKGLSYQFEGQNYHSFSHSHLPLHQTKKRFYMFFQMKDMSNAKFVENFQNFISVEDTYGGNWERAQAKRQWNWHQQERTRIPRVMK